MNPLHDRSCRAILRTAGLALFAAARLAAAPAKLEYNRDVRLILSDKCFKCHGPDSQARKAELRLDVRGNALAEHDGGRPIAPGDAEKSELVRRIESSDPDEQMPPRKSSLRISKDEIAVLRRWIAEGAEYQGHWSFIAPVRPAVPEISDFKFRNGVDGLSDWSANPIDGFILKKIAESGLAPSREATPGQLIRRMTLDLTGLPPTPAEADAFVAECREGSSSVIRHPSLSALADRLLASPAYGERMAGRWLDAARYADTNGYQSDGERSMWRWRDWVIDAFNRNMPFDQFTIEQLAGDLLPGATREQRIATGFNRNHRGNAEGGIIPEEYAAEYVVDRVDTTATVWLGLTMGCARCHDHKYDPLTQREFYSVFAFFNNVPEKGRAVKTGNSPPVLTAPTDAQERELAKIEKQLAAAEARLRVLEPQISAAENEWEKSLAEEEVGQASSPVGVGRASSLSGGASQTQWTVTNGLQARFELDGKLTGTFGKNADAKFEGGDAAFAPARGTMAAALDGKRFIHCGDVGDFGFFGKFTLAAWIQPRGAEGGAILSRMVEQAADSAFASDSEGYSMHLKSGRVQVHLTKRWLDDALRVETEAALAPEQWHHITIVYDGSRLASGVSIFINGQPQKTRVLLDQLNQTFQTKQPLRIGAGGGPANRFHGLISDVRVYGRTLSAEEIGIVSTTESVAELAAISPVKRTAAQAAKLRSCFLAEHAPAPLREAQTKAAALHGLRAKFVESLPTVMVMEEMAAPRETFVLKRGVYDQRGERVTPGVPASLPPLPADAAKNRLAFAQWLVSPANPLTARVAVNHQWQMIFGTGLVKTAEDFGSQGEAPSHPELLDWLATEFVRTGWDVKRLLKLIVTSATYRQRSGVRNQKSEVRSRESEKTLNANLTSDLRPLTSGSFPLTPDFTRDPDNRLLARGPRVRLPAEMIRDQALAVSGLLVHEIGGPSVKPYQPPGLWKELSGTDYVQDHGDALWRRSLYTFWKRTSPQPTMMTFDAAGREMCSVRPSRTDTPLQALALMNDVTFVEAARCLAQRVMREAATPEDRVRLAFRLVLTRAPRPAELKVLLDDLHDHLARFRADPGAAQSLVSAGESPRDAKLDAIELAAYTAVAGLILNLDEAITKQ